MSLKNSQRIEIGLPKRGLRVSIRFDQRRVVQDSRRPRVWCCGPGQQQQIDRQH